MVRLTFPALAMLSLLPFVTAAPAAASPDNVEIVPFSIEKWATDIGNDPEGDHLSVEEAVIAFEATLNSTRLQKRSPICNHIPFKECRIADAVACINEASRKGSQSANIAAGQASRSWCGRGTAQLWASTNGAFLQQVKQITYLQVAQSGGKIMDHCTRADGRVQGSWVFNQQINVVLSTRLN
ncbi:hypothetical protein D7B24_000393 [Verticillium nonalfalfae]|uniref:Ricin B lectin domain-containing protein n=1 Tax=Verticillium nonalfalfae TaxID=1051616 RepID=A0A3M9Y5S0_9PEZI|nr:uncharacterized protein D7B24_000393 [Verticillium nonalfalfae]RNJ54490.1 hypothetical protein D7B24_000393 [Verticillium nonalfalfae]